MSFSDYLELELLDHIFNDAAWSPPANVFVALCTATPDDTDTGSTITEPSGGSYARVSTSASDWNAAAAGVKDNGNAITFPQATADWGTVTHVCLVDASSAGNMLAWGALTQSKAVNNGDTAEFAAGDLDVTLD